MINWEKYDFNDEQEVQIVDGDKTFTLKVKLIEYEWSLHREPYLADLKVIETTNNEEYPLESILRLPIETKDMLISYCLHRLIRHLAVSSREKVTSHC